MRAGGNILSPDQQNAESAQKLRPHTGERVDLQRGAERSVKKRGETLLFFSQRDHDLCRFVRQNIIARRVPEHKESEIVLDPALLHAASGQQNTGIFLYHLPGIDPDHRAVAAVLVLVSEEIPARSCPGRVLLRQIHQHPGCLPAALGAVNTLEEANHLAAQLDILLPAAGVEILPVAIGILLLSCKAGGKIHCGICSGISDRDARKLPLRLGLLSPHDQHMDPVKTGDQVPVTEPGDLIDHSVSLQLQIRMGAGVCQPEIDIESHQLQLEKVQLPFLPAPDGRDRGQTVHFDRDLCLIKRPPDDDTPEISACMKGGTIDRNPDCKNTLGLARLLLAEDSAQSLPAG